MAVELNVDGSVEEIVAKLRRTQQELEGVADGYDNIASASRRAVAGATQGAKAVGEESKKAGKELNTQAGIIENLEAHLSRLREGQKKAMSIEDIKKYNTEIAKTEKALDEIGNAGGKGLDKVNERATASVKLFGQLRAQVSSTFAPLIAAAAGGAAIGGIISEVNDFAQASADLSAITGATGEQLEFMKQKAVEVGVTTTASAAETLKAYQLIASAKPELLQNAEALAAITDQAIILADASGLTLPEAAKALTDSLAQFSAPASEAGRFINILAAASKEGAVEIPATTEALVKFGVAAKSANIEVEESVALIQALGEKGSAFQGAEGGTKLRNILGKLSATDVLPKDAIDRLKAAGIEIEKLSDKSLSLEARLRALAPIQNDANTLTALFGDENRVAAQAVLQSIDRYAELKTKITGTNTAIEQATTRTATAGIEYQKLKNALSALIQGSGGSFGELLAVGLRLTREFLVGFANALKELPDFINRNGTALILLATAVALYYRGVIASTAADIANTVAKKAKLVAENAMNAAMFVGRGLQLLYTAATLVLTGQISLATAAQWGWNAAMSANPIGALVTLLILAGGAIAAYVNSQREAVREARLMGEIQKEASLAIAEEKSNLELLVSIARDENIAKEKRIEAIKKLNELSPEYLGNLTLETINTDGATKAINLYLEALNKKAIAEAAQNKRTELYKQLLEAENKENEEFLEWSNRWLVWNSDSRQQQGAKFKQEEINKINAEITALDKLIKKKIEEGQITVDNVTKTTETETVTGGADTEAEIKKREALAKEKQEAELAAMRDGLAKQLRQEDIRHTDLMKKLKKFHLNTAEEEAQHGENVLKIKADWITKQFEQEKKRDEEQANLDKKTGLTRLAFIWAQAQKEARAIEDAIKATQGGKITAEQQKQVNFLRQKATDEYIKGVAEFYDKDLKAKEHHDILMLEKERKNYKTQKEFEAFKQKEILKIRLDYAEQNLKLVEAQTGADSDAALNLRKIINEIKGALDEIAAKGGAANKFDFWKMVGLDPEDPKNKRIIGGIQQAVATAIDVTNQFLAVARDAANQRAQIAQEELDQIQSLISEKESQLDREIELSKAGYANDVAGKQAEIDQLKEQEKKKKQERIKALEEQKKVQRAQLVMDTITQTSSLITAAAQVFNSVASIPFVGVALGIALVGAMIGAFVAARVQAFKAVNSSGLKAEKGMFGVVGGRRHSEGGERFGDHIEIEQGEAFGVFSRGATRKHGKVIEAFTNALNKGNDSEIRGIGELLAGTGISMSTDTPDRLGDKSIVITHQRDELRVKFDSDDLRENNKLLRQYLENQNTDTQTEYFDDYRVEKTKGRTRIIKKQ